VKQWEWHLLEDKDSPDHVVLNGVTVRVGDSVRLRPRKGGDILDIALTEKIATIESIEQDYEGKTHFAVVLEDDPGWDMGILRQPGHRFFFGPDELEPLADDDKRSAQ
jgi:hypothetical protein